MVFGALIINLFDEIFDLKKNKLKNLRKIIFGGEGFPKGSLKLYMNLLEKNQSY